MAKKAKKGFTLSELLVVVLVIGILAAIATPMYNKAIKKSRASDALHVLTTASEKQENYFVNNGKYAKSFSELSAPIKGLNAAEGSSAKVGNFSYQMTDSCIVADRPTDKYKIYKNFVTQQEGCVGEGCVIIKDMVPTVSFVGCEVVSGETDDPSVGPTDPCIATPALCCPNGSVWDTIQTKCVVKNPCSDGKIFNPVTKTCVCNNSCSGDGVQNAETCACACPTTCPLTGQVRDDFCNCICPADKPNWNGTSCMGACAAPKTRWTDNGCECPLDNPIWNGSSCIKCPSHLTFDGTSCACPDGLPNEWGGHCYACSEPNFNSGKSNCADTSTGPAGIFTDIMCSCACTAAGSAFENGKCVCVVPTPVWTGSVCEKCPDIQEWNGAQCVCPSDKPVWNGTKCEACPVAKPWDGTQCSCPKATPYEYNGQCNQCRETEAPSNGVCCPEGKISEDGKTCVDICKAESTPWVATTNNVDTCPGGNISGEYSCDGSFVGTCTDIRFTSNDKEVGQTNTFEFDPPSGYKNNYYDSCSDNDRLEGKSIGKAYDYKYMQYTANFAYSGCGDNGYQFWLLGPSGGIQSYISGGLSECPDGVDGNALGCRKVCGIEGSTDNHGCKSFQQCYTKPQFNSECDNMTAGHPIIGNGFVVFSCKAGDGGTKYKFKLIKCGNNYEERSITCCAKK